jgi:uncharacterized protein YdiU (UPF0061 family)
MRLLMKTSSVSILGLTIDYGKGVARCTVHGGSLMSALGPYAFMDIFDPMHVCNHSDQEGRYAYKVTFP